MGGRNNAGEPGPEIRRSVRDSGVRTYPDNARTGRDTTNATDMVFTGASADGRLSKDAGQELYLKYAKANNDINGIFNIFIDPTDTANQGGGHP